MQALLSSERPLAYQLEGSGLVTSLPYLDDLSDKALLKQAKKLISQELEAAEDCSAKVDLQGLDTDVETPHLDHLAEAALGKRSTASGSRDREPPKRDPYEASAISIEQLKERYARVSRLIHLKIIKKNIHALAQVQLQYLVAQPMVESFENSLELLRHLHHPHLQTSSSLEFPGT